MLLPRMIKWEHGLLEEALVIELFQELIDTGMIEHQSGVYQAKADELIAAGLVHLKAKT